MTDPILKKATELTKHTKPRYHPIAGRIAYVVSHGQSYASNGYAIRTHGIAKALNGHGLETLCFVRPGRPWDMGIAKNTITPEMQIDGVRYIHSRWPGDKKPGSEEQKFTATISRLIELFTIYRPQVVIAASNHEIALPALVAARQLGLPFQYEVRGFWEVSRSSRDPAWEDSAEYQEHYNRECWVISRADQLYTLNTQMKEELVARGAKPEQIDLVPNSVSGMPRVVAQSNVREQYGIPKDAYVLGYIGAITEYEGLDHLLEALKLLKKEKVYALIVGGYSPVNRQGCPKPEPIVKDLQKLARSYGIHKQVIFTGRVDHEKLPEYFAAVDATVIPRAPLPVCELVSAIKPLEYLSYGKPLIASNVAPQAEVLERGKLGWLYEKGNAEALATTVRTLREMPTEDIKLKTKAAVNTIKSRYQWKQTTAAIRMSCADPEEKARKSNTAQSKGVASATNAPVSNLTALSIMDEISEECWRYELTAYPINRKSYKEQVSGSRANFCFLESCWKGNRGTWEYAFTSPGFKHANAQALLDLIPRVKGKMPLVFWNKEDPMHYERYLPIAKSADIIFTTDSNKVADYKRDVPDADVYAVPFAAQQRICNPSDRFRSEPESVCFAGSYYGVGHDERKRQMNALLPSIIEFKGAIYDRMSKIGNDRYKFPDQYTPFIRDAVPFTEVVKLYKQFKVFLNVNTIVDSPTMMSRRVYELLACGTPVVSTPSKAIEEQFPGIVHVASDYKEANVIIERLLTDTHFWDKTSHLGYREVMKKHTYTHRVKDIEAALGYHRDESEPLVSIITCTRRPGMIDRIVENMTRQNHSNCELILVLQDFSPMENEELIRKIRSKKSNIGRIEVLVDDSLKTLGDRFNKAVEMAQGEYIAKMDDDDFYFENYLSDMLIPFTFGDYGMVGKKELYMYLSGSKKLIRRFSGMKHCEADFVAGPTFLIKKAVFDQVKFESRNTGEDSTFIANITRAGFKIYASDPFNFIQFRADPSNHTWSISDDEVLRSKQTEVIADFFDRSVCDF